MTDCVSKIIKLAISCKRHRDKAEQDRQDMIPLFVQAHDAGMNFAVISRLTDGLYTRQNIELLVKKYKQTLDK
jgi:hypothetical protein